MRQKRPTTAARTLATALTAAVTAGLVAACSTSAPQGDPPGGGIVPPVRSSTRGATSTAGSVTPGTSATVPGRGPRGESGGGSGTAASTHDALDACLGFVRGLHEVDYRKPFPGRDFGYLELIAPGALLDRERNVSHVAKLGPTAGEQQFYNGAAANHSRVRVMATRRLAFHAEGADWVRIDWYPVGYGDTIPSGGRAGEPQLTFCRMTHGNDGRWLVAADDQSPQSAG